jgi:ATP synthase protein I
VFIINQKNKSTSKVLRSYAMVSQLGITMIVTIAICFFVGIFLDNRFDTAPIFTIIGAIVGSLAALRNMYVLIMRGWKD